MYPRFWLGLSLTSTVFHNTFNTNNSLQPQAPLHTTNLTLSVPCFPVPLGLASTLFLSYVYKVFITPPLFLSCVSAFLFPSMSPTLEVNYLILTEEVHSSSTIAFNKFPNLASTLSLPCSYSMNASLHLPFWSFISTFYLPLPLQRIYCTFTLHLSYIHASVISFPVSL